MDDKWLAALDAAIHGEMDRVSQQLTQRVKELAERYETPLPQMVSRVAELEAKVNRHLERMGSHGSEARLQADRGGGDSGGLGGRSRSAILSTFATAVTLIGRLTRVSRSRTFHASASQIHSMRNQSDYPTMYVHH